MPTNPLDSGCLRPFDVVARHLNLSRAATALDMTQPALSYRIKQLEALLGVQLFPRRPRGLAPPNAGETRQTAEPPALAPPACDANPIRSPPAHLTMRPATPFHLPPFFSPTRLA